MGIDSNQEAERSPEDRSGIDLLGYRWVRRFLCSRLYPALLVYPGVAILGLILFFSLFGTIRAGSNFGTVVTWTLWWALLPVLLLLFGRLWCAVCPVAAGIDLVGRFHPGKRRMPGRLLKRYGIWMMGSFFLFLTWADHVWGITGSPRATGWVFAGLLSAALLVGGVYQRRTWCRYLCPLGALNGLYAMTAPLALRAKQALCRRCRTRECYLGTAQTPGCPLFERPAQMDPNRHCNLCARCISNCPHGALKLMVDRPLSWLARVRRPRLGEAALSLGMVGIVYAQTAGMTTVYPRYMKWAIETSGIWNYHLIFTLSLLVFLGLVVGAFWMSARFSARQFEEPMAENFAVFGYAFVPLALAGHVGHNLFHLVVEGQAAVQTALDQLRIPLTLFTVVEQAGEEFHPAGGWVKGTQLGILLLGGLGALYLLWRLAGRRAKGRIKGLAAHLVLLSVLFGLYLHIFLAPMNLRHVH